MAASLPGRRLVSFRLGQIPEHVRIRAMERLLRGVDPKLPTVAGYAERIALGVAVQEPSERVYWIPRDAWDRVMAPKPRRARVRR